MIKSAILRVRAYNNDAIPRYLDEAINNHSYSMIGKVVSIILMEIDLYLVTWQAEEWQ